MGLFGMLGVATKKDKKLQETGIRVNAVIKDVAVNNSVSINGSNPRKLICEGLLPDGTLKYFESTNVSAFVQPDVIGRPITVFVDPSDYSKYYVDVSAYK